MEAIHLNIIHDGFYFTLGGDGIAELGIFRRADMTNLPSGSLAELSGSTGNLAWLFAMVANVLVKSIHHDNKISSLIRSINFSSVST